MNTRRILVKKVEENDGQEEIPPQVEEVEQVPQGAQGVNSLLWVEVMIPLN